jgi:hypothetical protein
VKIAVTEVSRDEQKLWLILFQVKAIRARLNSLAVQRGLFWTLALMVGAAAGIVAAAMDLGPLTFLTIAAVLVALATAGSIAALRSAWLRLASPARAAAIADVRGELKGRLATIQAVAGGGRPSSLWPYLVEDTYGARGQFEPSKIEPRWFSRAAWAALAAMILAALLIPGAIFERDRQVLMAEGGGLPATGGITADINNLDIRPADPALAPNAEVYADPATLGKLRERLAQEQGAGGALSKFANKARTFAGELQDEITGQRPQDQPPVRLRLTDRGADQYASGGRDSNKPPSAQADARNGVSGGLSGGDAENPSAQQQNGSAPDSSMGSDNPSVGGGMSLPDSQTAQPPSDSQLAGDGGGGSEHGSGTDPSSLFGAPSPPQLGADSFKIAIDADPSDEASGPGSPGYLPPKVHAPLNSTQYPDEPLARASVPSVDQMTIKRVFER